MTTAREPTVKRQTGTPKKNGRFTAPKDWTIQELLFLDFDGVLHAQPPRMGEPWFSQEATVSRWLDSRPGVAVVVTSAWRLRHGLPQIVHWLEGTTLGQRIVGATPIHSNGLKPTGRGGEIDAWRLGVAPDLVDLPWAVLDDMPMLFDGVMKPYLVFTQDHVGVQADDLVRVGEVLDRQRRA